MEDFKRRAGLDILHVPYQGSPKAMLDQMAGKMRLLAVGTNKRMRAFPDTPTIAELGYPGFEAVAWVGAAMPAGAPRELRERLGTEIVRIVRSPEFEQRMTTLGMVTRPAGAAEFGAFLRAEYERWGRIVRESGARVE